VPIVVGITVALGLGLWYSRSALVPAALPSGPNVLLIVLDTTRADYLSCYGYKERTTPRIDRLASEGTRYTRAYSTDFWTLPSHATILTGLYPTEAGATSETNHLPTSLVTLAERFQTAGYSTGAVVCNTWVSGERGFAQGFTDYEEMWRAANRPGPLAPPEAHDHPAADRAVAWIDRHAAEPAPFFLFVNFNVAHLPYRPSPPLRRRFLTRDWPAARLEKVMGIMEELPYFAGALKLDGADFKIMRELYAAGIAESDEWVGLLVDALAANGVLDNTLVVITADHGENLGDHSMIGHLLSMHDTTLHVPLILRYPGRFDGGAVKEELVSLIDLFPTILDVCSLLDGTDSASGQRSLCHPHREPTVVVFAENDRPVNGIRVMKQRFPAFDTSTIEHSLRAVRTERYKLIWRVGDGTELFDVSSDPGELYDIAQARTDVRDELLARLQTWNDNLEQMTDLRPFESRDVETLEQLRALGYVGGGEDQSSDDE